MLNVKDFSAFYNNKLALDNISININHGELIFLLGANGSGKSTLLKAIIGFIKNTEGVISFQGDRNVKNYRDKLSYMPQHENVVEQFPITAKEVILQGIINGSFDSKNFIEICEVTDTHKLLPKNISDLSGGELQRVFVARTLLRNASLYIMDEPFSNVDVTTQNKILDYIKEQNKKGKSFLLSTHNLKLAQAWANKVILLNKKLVYFGECSVMMKKDYIEQAFGEDTTFEEDTNLFDHHHHTHHH